MSNIILTPVTLWNDFDASLPPSCTVLESRSEDGMCLQSLRFFGRAVGDERVNIFALFGFPEGKNNFPTILLLPDASCTADEAIVRRFVKKGYAVLMPDYRGEWEGTENYTVYPNAVAYANTAKAERHIDYADETARETSWYEWVAVSRYCVEYLKTLPQVGSIGAIGLRAGGDVLWQLAATCSDLKCAIPVCAGGWRAYRGINKFGDSTELRMNDERYRFLAAVDAQAYAQNVRCPVLMLCSTNDSRFDADRAFDTFARINAEMLKTFYFTARYDGHIGNTGLNDLDLFIDKFLKGREVFIPTPVNIGIEEDEGELVARIKFDPNGEVKYCDVYMAEDNLDSATRDWRKCECKRSEGEDEQIFRLDAYKNSSRVFVFAKAKYSCGFAVSSKIAVKRLEKKYTNQVAECRVLYSSETDSNSFTIDRFDKKVLANCFLDNSVPPVQIVKGPFGIEGIYSAYGLKLYRINDERFRPAENALLKFDVYAPSPCILQLAIFANKNGMQEKYSCELRLSGGERWSAHTLSAKDFKNAVNKPLGQINEAKSITFYSEDKYLVNNLIWL